MSELDKKNRRSELLAARRAVSEEVHHTEARRIRSHLAAALEGARVVAAYVPIGTEPGSPEMLEVLAQLCEDVLLPVTRTGPDGESLPLQWGRYRTGQLTAGRFGLQEPSGPPLPAEALAQADVVLVPAVAVDRRGVRLGRGGGFYDRSLPLCGSATRLVAVVRDDELVDELPSEPHDVRMTHALTPSGVISLRE